MKNVIQLTTRTKMISISDILNASGRISGKVHKTPILRNTTVDEITGREIYFKGKKIII